MNYSNHNPDELAMLEEARERRPLCRTRDDEGRRLFVPRCDTGCPAFLASEQIPGRLRSRCDISGEHVTEGDACLPAIALAFDMVASS